ncbi:Hypothetical protein TPAR_09570 [Tolypocladium paradoxum]|uniref:Uncharacterized protein n=1 Tax=Tolypocladium paradoxum TaxID=94208 RepID=A0A2S4L1Y6_9HYPO|nr:Hypothetical protein TPAR_09570 [Tolypocladium paradoxum]
MRDLIQESAPLIKVNVDKAQEYSKTEEHDSEHDSQYQPSRAQLPSSRYQLLPLASSFLLGILAMVLASAGWHLLFVTKTAPNRKFPEMREGTDALGCRYSIVLHAWLPKDCLTDADVEDEDLMYEGRDWPYEVEGRNLTMSELRDGQHHHFTYV